MKTEVLPSGSFRVRKQINGKNIQLIFDHMPTENEILLGLGDYLDGTPVPKEVLIFSNAAKQYVERKRNIMSPKTVKEYLGIPSRLSEKFALKNIYEITEADIQIEINTLAGSKAPKTVKNYYIFIKSVLKAFRGDLRYNVTLPQVEIVEPYIPTDEEVQKLLAYMYAERPKYYLCTILGAYGLRREEIMAVTADDLDGNTLNITKGKVQNDKNEWVIKTTKTPKSRRKIELPQEIADTIREKGVAFDCYPSGINKVITTACKRLGINHITLHKLRHYFATKLISEKVDVMTIASLGGWSSPDMIYRRYGHAMADKKRDALNFIDAVIVSDKLPTS